MGKYSDIAMALNFSRGIGKTYATIKYAPKFSVVICHDANQMKVLFQVAKGCGRMDLSFGTPETMKGLKGTFVADHLSVSHWLNEAQGEIDRLKKRVAELEKGEWLKDGK